MSNQEAPAVNSWAGVKRWATEVGWSRFIWLNWPATHSYVQHHREVKAAGGARLWTHSFTSEKRLHPCAQLTDPLYECVCKFKPILQKPTPAVWSSLDSWLLQSIFFPGLDGHSACTLTATHPSDFSVGGRHRKAGGDDDLWKSWQMSVSRVKLHTIMLPGCLLH